MEALLSRFDHRALIWSRSWHTESAKVGTHGVFHLCKDVVVFLENVMREVPALATPTDHSAATSFNKDVLRPGRKPSKHQAPELLWEILKKKTSSTREPFET
ncbi:unnamed protein product [Dovyalis caffra]|uniref:Uncharacterized protein n=1 Tax=Dovyalis caffra TaxID=77055 RepID=A0AAV1RJL3_9ROSI|nr:unnamed protein product [Dovyalis caffra]